REQRATAPQTNSASGESDVRDGSRVGGAAPRNQTSNIAVSTATWNPDRPYLRALSGINGAAFRAAFLSQEREYGDAPAFYFDVAEWMWRNDMKAGAAAMARNALELSSATIDTKIILAGRLLRYGAYDDAIWLNEQILQITPNKPQSLRNLALAIAAATDAKYAAHSINKEVAIAQLEYALGLLKRIVLTPASGDYDGIELISLMEANHIIARLRELGLSNADLAQKLDPRLTALLAVDIRVILEWNTDKSDMDLWVDEPSAERAIYNNPRTALGGRLSNDMTRGYGPEEYLLRNAPEGNYKVLANVFAADRLDPNGPTSVTVHLFRNWGMPNESSQSFVVEVTQRGRGAGVEIGQFRVGD
ncbi:MAG: DUF2135 domain-containing protein, partial [Pseudomonadota bacterium]